MTYQEEATLFGSIETIDLIYNKIQDEGKYKIPPLLFLNSLFFTTASALGFKGIKIKRVTSFKEKKIIPNFVAISFGKTGIGKDFVFKRTKEIYKPIEKAFEKKADAFFYERFEEGKPNKSYVKLSSYYIGVESSEQGIQKAAQTIKDLGFGSVNIFSDELLDNIGIMEPVFKKIKTAWDDGISYGPIISSDGGEHYFTVEDICFNALLFGSHEVIELKKDAKDKLISAYISGMTRRAFVYHNTWYKKSEMRNSNYETISKEEYDKFYEYNQELLNYMKVTDHIVLPDNIHKKLLKYDEDKQIEREQSKSPIAESLGSIQKIEKLLGIIAALDLETEINDKHLEFAIKFTELIDKTTESTVEHKPFHVQIYEELEKYDSLTKSDLVKNIKGLTAKAIESEIELTEDYAYKLGNTIISEPIGKSMKYSLQKMRNSQLDKIIVSVNADMSYTKPSGFIKKQGRFENLHKIVCNEFRYSAGTFKDEYINDANYLKEQNLIIIDVDEGMTIEEAKRLFSSHIYMIATTKSHQKDKSGIVCDRFRIILPTSSVFHLEPSVYKEMYVNIMNTLGIDSYDEKCKNASRWYYGVKGAKYWYNMDGEMLDIRPFIPNTSEFQYSAKAIDTYEEYVEKSDSNADSDTRIQGAIRWFLKNTMIGNRSDNLFKLGMLIADTIGDDNFEDYLFQANSFLATSLKDSEVRSTIQSIKRRI